MLLFIYVYIISMCGCKQCCVSTGCKLCLCFVILSRDGEPAPAEICHLVEGFCFLAQSQRLLDQSALFFFFVPAMLAA